MSLQVAETVLQQLGSRRFIAMTGAKSFVADENTLRFKLPSNFATRSINCVTITLNLNDLYDVTFSYVHGNNQKVVSSHDDVCADNLRGLFEAETGLAVSL
jgi:hypothetical protein